MRTILLLLIGWLALTGVALVFGDPLGLPGSGWEKALSLGHIWGGLLFLVIFPMYAWDHVRANRAWLRVLAGVTASGLTQLTAGVLLAVTGLVLLAYGEAAWTLLRDGHHWLTYLLLAALVGHYLSPKGGA